MPDIRTTRRAKRKYPNLSEDFRALVKETRIKKGITTRKMATDMGFNNPTAVSQYENGQRNFNYETAVLFRDYLKLKYKLPIPRPEEREPEFRSRIKRERPTTGDPFYIIVDDEVIEVLTYRRIGIVTKAQTIELP